MEAYPEFASGAGRTLITRPPLIQHPEKETPKRRAPVRGASFLHGSAMPGLGS